MTSYLFIEIIPRRKTYTQILTMDVFYNLITCKACNIGLPHEWAKGHYMKHKMMIAFSWNVIDLEKWSRILGLIKQKTGENIEGMSELDELYQHIDETSNWHRHGWWISMQIQWMCLYSKGQRNDMKACSRIWGWPRFILVESQGIKDVQQLSS